MPRVRRDQHYNQLTPFERGRIVGMHEAGLPFREIAKRLGRSDSTWRTWSNEGSGRRRRGSGRARITNERQERRLRRLASVNPFEATRSVEATWRAVLERQVSMQTIYRRIRSCGLALYRPIVRLPLTPEHRVARLEWCTLREHWVDDGTKSSLVPDGRLCVRRARGQRLNLQFAFRRHSGLTPGVMVCGIIQFGSQSPLVFIQGCHTFKGICNSVFQQDNARPHIARVTQRVLMTITSIYSHGLQGPQIYRRTCMRHDRQKRQFYPRQYHMHHAFQICPFQICQYDVKKHT
jgi:transposase